MALDPKLIKYPSNTVEVVNLSDSPIYKVILTMTEDNASCRGWLIDNIGAMADLYKKNQWRSLSAEYPWTSREKSNNSTLFMFYRKEDAMLFVLRWL